MPEGQEQAWAEDLKRGQQPTQTTGKSPTGGLFDPKAAGTQLRQDQQHARNSQKTPTTAEQFAKEHGIADTLDIKEGEKGPGVAKALGEALGSSLKQGIEQGHFKAFILALILGIIKDGVDLVSGGTIGVILNIFITAALWAILASQSGILKRMIKKQAARMIGTALLEFIPFLSFIPTYTILILWFKRDVDKQRKKYEKALDAYDESIKKEEARQH